MDKSIFNIVMPDIHINSELNQRFIKIYTNKTKYVYCKKITSAKNLPIR